MSNLSWRCWATASSSRGTSCGRSDWWRTGRCDVSQRDSRGRHGAVGFGADPLTDKTGLETFAPLRNRDNWVDIIVGRPRKGQDGGTCLKYRTSRRFAFRERLDVKFERAIAAKRRLICPVAIAGARMSGSLERLLEVETAPINKIDRGTAWTRRATPCRNAGRWTDMEGSTLELIGDWRATPWKER